MDPLARSQPRSVQITTSEVIIGRGAACDLRVSKGLTWVSNKHFTVGCAHTPEQTSTPEPWQHRRRLLVTSRDALCDTAPPPHRRDTMRHIYIKDHSSNGTYVSP